VRTTAYILLWLLDVLRARSASEGLDDTRRLRSGLSSACLAIKNQYTCRLTGASQLASAKAGAISRTPKFLSSFPDHLKIVVDRDSVRSEHADRLEKRWRRRSLKSLALPGIIALCPDAASC
jgi:hypothetical protein